MTDTLQESPVHTALLEHLDHLLLNLLPFCHAEGAAQVLAAGLATVRTMHDLALIDGFQAVGLIDRVHTAYAAQISPSPE